MRLFLDNFANLDSFLQIYPLLLQGLQLTVLLSLIALPTAAALGLVVAVVYGMAGRLSRIFLICYMDFFRSFPVLVLLVLVFYGLPFIGITLGNLTAVVLALVLNNSGYFGEIFRAGIESSPREQRETATALGLKPLHIMFLIILPQAIRKVMAPLATNSLELVKTTSIASLVAVPELLRSARVAQEQTYNPTPLIAAAAIFFVLLLPLARLVARLERKMMMEH